MSEALSRRPKEVDDAAKAFPAGPSILMKLAQLHQGDYSDQLWACAPGRDKKEGMKYPIVESDRMIPFLQDVVSVIGLAYTRIAVQDDCEPGGRNVLQQIYYLVWCKETNEGMIYRIDWVSDTSHNDQAGGLTRAHRRFLKGLTGFIEQDEDKIEQLRPKPAAGPYAPPPQAPPQGPYAQHQGYSGSTGQQQSMGPAPTSTYQQEQQRLNSLPPHEQIRQMADEAFPARDPEDLSAGPAASGEATLDAENARRKEKLLEEGFELGLAAQIAMTRDPDWLISLQENGYPPKLAHDLVLAAKTKPFSALKTENRPLDDAVKDLLLQQAGGNHAAVEAAFAGTGFAMGEAPPNAMQALVACMNTPILTPNFP